MEAGQIFQEGSDDSLFASPQHARTKLFQSQIPNSRSSAVRLTNMPPEVRPRNVATRLTSGYLLWPLVGLPGASKDPAWWGMELTAFSGLSDTSRRRAMWRN